jgi:hypothetical protein
MNDIVSQEHKDSFFEGDGNNGNEHKVIAKVSRCLTPEHNQCSGFYHDSLTGSYLVSCHCNCHSPKNPTTTGNQQRGPNIL